MSKLVINGGRKLSGEIAVHGAKNSSLPILAATYICGGKSYIHNCPNLSDVDAAINILVALGCTVEREPNLIIVDASHASGYEISEVLMREMRSSIVFLGAIVAKAKKAHLSFPGGCELGPRPIDLHISSLKALGVDIIEEHGFINCQTKKIVGKEITLSFPSVGATENILLAASTAEGTTVIRNAAREPEIVDLINFLLASGADITGAGQSTIIIKGTPKLTGAHHTVIPDRITTATYMSAAAITGSTLTITGVNHEHIMPIIPAFIETGCEIDIKGDRLVLKAPNKLKAVKSIKTMVYPGFPTDAQPPILAMTTVAQGTSIFVETIFENRFRHVHELNRLGANIAVEGSIAIVTGVPQLMGANVSATDLRGGAALVVAALAASGRTVISQIEHIDRGYESIEKNLKLVNCDIERIK